MVGGGGGGSEAAAMSPAASGGKRGRGPEEDVYVDNLHSHKRYLSEIMASSMNGLSVGDSVADNMMVSPMRLDNASCFRDEMITQYSPMSEESDDYRYFDTHVNNSGNQTDVMRSPSTSPVSSPHRFQKQCSWFSTTNPCHFPSNSLPAVACSHARCSAEHEGRSPSSPNDMCHGGDLRRTALLRAVQMRVQGPNATDFSFGNGHEQKEEHAPAHAKQLEHGQRQLGCVKMEQGSSYPKSVQVAEFRRPKIFGQCPDDDVDFIEKYGSDCSVNREKFNHDNTSKFNSDNISGKHCVDVAGHR
ncbi:hypothetical protein ACP4OV_020921 [Aristida adscensionis]